MNMDARIILGGQTPDLVNTLARSTQAAAMTNQNQFRNALADVYQTQGPAIMQGDQKALNALSQVDPMAAMDVQSNRLGMEQTRQSMQIDREKMAMLRDEAKRQARLDAANLSAEQRKATADKLSGILRGAAAMYQAGDRDTYNAWVQHNGLDPNQYPFEQFPAHLAQATGTIEALTEAQEYAQGPQDPAAMQTLRIRAQEAGLQPGTPQYQEFMRTGGRPAEFTEFEGDGFSYRTGVGAPPAGNDQSIPSSNVETPDEEAVGNEAFGLEGILKGVANTVTDVATGTEAFPEAARQSRLFADLETDLLAKISQSFDRQPAQRYMEIIRDTLPRAGNLTQGPAGARNRMNELRQRFMDDLATLEQQEKVISPQNRREISEIRSKALALQQVIRRIDRGIASLDEPVTGGEISQEDREYLESLGLEVD